VIPSPLPLASQEDPESRELLSSSPATQRERASQAHGTNNYQRVHMASFAVHAAMGHQIRFQKAGLGLLPLLDRADRNLVLQQRSRSCSGNATHTSRLKRLRSMFST
jgi:hypothetical protein